MASPTAQPMLLPSAVKYSPVGSDRSAARHGSKPVWHLAKREIQGLASLCVAVTWKAATTNMDKLMIWAVMEQLKQVTLWLTMALSAIVMARELLDRMRRQISSLNQLRRSVSKGSLQAAKRLTSASSLSQLSKSLPWSAEDRAKSFSSNNSTHRTCRLAANDKPVVSSELLNEMTLVDVTTAIRYAVEFNQPEFDDTHIELQSMTMQQAIDAMKFAVKESVGVNDVVRSASTTNVDALWFCAAMRIFCDWRMIGQVPPNYKAYEMGMNLGKRDLIQNLHKIETAAHAWMDTHSEQLRTPSLRQLLEYEIQNGVHDRLPKLKDHTAAIGLLWVLRQIHYQEHIYINLLDCETYTTSHEAVCAAYHQVIGKYHGWFVQQMFQHSLKGAPPALEIYKCMRPRLLERLSEQDISISEPPPYLLNLSCSSFDDSSDSEDGVVADHYYSNEKVDDAHCDLFGSHLIREWENAGKYIQGEFGRFFQSLLQVMSGTPEHRLTARAMKQHDSHSDLQYRRDALSSSNFLSSKSTVADEITKDACEQMRIFTGMVQSVLSELFALINELNMNDPTKV